MIKDEWNDKGDMIDLVGFRGQIYLDPKPLDKKISVVVFLSNNVQPVEKII